MQQFNEIPTLSDRLRQIVELSYTILCNKVAAGSFNVPNEASIQMQLGSIINWVGKMFEFDKHDRVVVELESPKEIAKTSKSISGRARCDIYVTLSCGESKAVAAIELKHLKKDPNEAVTDNRFSVLQDLENLEQYKASESELLCYEIVYTENINHTLCKENCVVNIGNGAIAPQLLEYTQNRKVKLNGTYTFLWNVYKEGEGYHCFLKVAF